jgi:hypothetical protein
MGFLDNLGDMIKQATGDDASAADVHAAYDQVAQAAPQDALADGLSHAFKSAETPPFEQMVAGLFARSNPDQKMGMLNQLIASLGPSGVAQALAAAGGSGGLGGLVSGGSLTPQQAQQVPAETVQVLAEHAARKNPSIMDTAAGFYAQHPTLVKAIGAGALALLMSRISASRR